MGYVHNPNDVTSVAASGYTFGGFACSANYEHSNTNYKAWRCFDHDVTYAWASSHIPSVGDEDILVLDAGIGNSYKYVGMDISPMAGESPYGIIDFKIEGSHDGTNYTTLKSVTGATWTANTTNSYTWINSTAYRYLRLKVSQCNGTVGQTYVGEVEVYIPASWSAGKISGVAPASIAKRSGVARSNISKVSGK